MFDNTPPDNSSVINGKAVASLALGILSILLPFIGYVFDIFSFIFIAFGIALGVLSIVLYHKARNEMAWTGEGGKAIAIAGLNCGITGIFIHILLIFIYITFAPAFR